MKRLFWTIVAGVATTTIALSLPIRDTQAFTVRAQPGAAAALTLMCGPESCARSMLALLNSDRRHAGIAPLALMVRQTSGVPGCVGSYGHSVAMARSGNIWHINARFPRASFPHNVCVTYSNAGENVGNSATGNTAQDLQILDRLMMSEPHSSSQCLNGLSHACNILNASYRQVGIGIVVTAGTTWLTEDFVG